MPVVPTPAVLPARHQAPARRYRAVLRVVAAVVVLGLAAGATLALLAYRRLEGNITAHDILHQLGPDRPTAQPVQEGEQRPLTILVMGSDTRDTADGRYGEDVYGARSDTTVLVHLSADRTRAEVVSIPRDSVVDLPQCFAEDGSTLGGGRARFNEAYALGGPACVQRTVEQLTGVLVDHYVVVDFAGFEDMVDAIGGVEVCLPEAVDDPKAHLVLPAGRQEVDGREALGYARARYSLGDGSDLSRIDRQQALMSSMVQRVQSKGVLLRPDRLFAFLDAATSSLTTDPRLADLGLLRGLAQSVRDMDTDAVSFLTVPVLPDPANPQVTVVWDEARAGALWEALRLDEPVPGTPAAERAAAAREAAQAEAGTPAPSAEALDSPLRTWPGDIRVRVLNGSGVPGAARQAAEDLAAAGFAIVEVGDAPEPVTATLVRRSPDYDESGRTLLTAARGAEEVVDPGLGRTLELVVGPGFAGVDAVDPGRFAAADGPQGSGGSGGGGGSGAPRPAATLEARSAAADICS